jgi:hypothetical protein
MPKLPKGTENLTFFLYDTEENALAGRDTGGTGFFVGVRSKARPDRPHLIAITNWHVAVSGTASVMRVNATGGGVKVFDFGPHDWVFRKDSWDLAALPFEASGAGLNIMCMPADSFVTEAMIQELEIGPGDDVFMPGRLVDVRGLATNVPALRFGNISMMPYPMEQDNGVSDRPSYLVDMHSRDGFSGSPVIVYRTLGQNLENLGDLNPESCFMQLLGVHWGAYPEWWEIHRTGTPPRKRKHRSEIALDATATHIKGKSGLTCVAPAWAIQELLDDPKIAAWLAAQEQKRVVENIANPRPVTEA